MCASLHAAPDTGSTVIQPQCYRHVAPNGAFPLERLRFSREPETSWWHTAVPVNELGRSALWSYSFTCSYTCLSVQVQEKVQG
jgi:hypothetical protein